MRSVFPHLISALLAAVLLAVTVPAAARTLERLQLDGTLRVGVALAPPWALRDAGNELIGFEIDVANRLAADLEVEPVIVVYPFDRLIRALESGEIDIIAAGLTITPDRARHVNFSQPYAIGGVTLATNLEGTARVGRLDDLNDSAYRIAAVSGSVAMQVVDRALPRAELVEFDDSDAASRALVDGSVDALVEEEPLPTYLALEHPRRIDVPLSRPLLETPSAFAIPKGDADFLAYLNAWITARDSDTWLPTTYGYWFGSLGWRDRVGDAPEVQDVIEQPQ